MGAMKTIHLDLEEIARRHFPSVETLETRQSDSLDFHDVAVWCLQAALQEAYWLGLERGAELQEKEGAK